jgi:hypothetical protein
MVGAMLLCTAASLPTRAQLIGDSQTYCGWATRGVYACRSTYETQGYTVRTLCGYGLNSACSTRTYLKPPPKPLSPPPPAVEQAGDTLLLRGGRAVGESK